MNPKTMSRSDLAKIIDHTLLKPEATRDDVAKLVAEARELEVYAVCISPNMLPLEDMELGHVQIATVCGFPSGSHERSVKAFEAEKAVAHGAQEVDMVIDLSAVKDGRWEDVHVEIAAVREVVPTADQSNLMVSIVSVALRA